MKYQRNPQTNLQIRIIKKKSLRGRKDFQCRYVYQYHSLLLIDTKNLLLLFTEKHSELSIECAPRFLQAKIVKQLGIGEIPTFK